CAKAEAYNFWNGYYDNRFDVW
nr:immunoglobulin heavy chain junction region [Macaca mulatta]MOV54259.1 immunoglobulin heavy chain junction region [Macaca mulatta]MOV54260.1 immunoglobulin heavy chain junction region [Macaca mulatta]MOV54317.1 immunoglobulin heavy chain junction region [Macaca mulatta]MOV55006.1 immunoglobulin heavy chain junction region [Macaca mulatta]